MIKYCQNFDNVQAKIQYIGKMHSFCGTSALHCDHAACQSRVVGSTSAACGSYVDPSDGDSFCRRLWCGRCR